MNYEDCELCAGTGKIVQADGPDDFIEVSCPNHEEDDMTGASEGER